jgi:hypothetical protein
LNAVAVPAQGRNRLQLILLALLFASPVIAAWVAWKFAVTEGVDGTTNAGQLIQPARPLQGAPWLDAEGQPLPADLLSVRWSYVLLAGDGCDALCVERLYLTRQVRTSVNKDMSRVQRVLLLTRLPDDLAKLRAEHPDLVVAVLDASTWQTFVDQFAVGADASERALYLVDPLGNLMMRYVPEVPAKGVLKDLRKLLKASQVG